MAGGSSEGSGIGALWTNADAASRTVMGRLVVMLRDPRLFAGSALLWCKGTIDAWLGIARSAIEPEVDVLPELRP